MSNITTNFFELLITPEIEDVFITERYGVDSLISADNLSTYLDKNSIISLYPIRGSNKVFAKPPYVEWLIKKIIFEKLQDEESSFDIDYKDGEVTLLNESLVQRKEYSVLRRLVLRVFHAKGKLLLALDPLTKIYNRLSLTKLLSNYRFSRAHFLTYSECLVFVEKHGVRKWARGKIRDIIQSETVKVEVPTLFDGTIEVTPARVIPSLSKPVLGEIVKRAHPRFDFDKEVKQLGDFTSREKLETIGTLFQRYIYPLFPITIRDTHVEVMPESVSGQLFTPTEISRRLEPQYVINRAGQPQIKDGRRLAALTKVNIDPKKAKEHKVVLFATRQTMGQLERVVNQLNNGITKGNYSFSLPTRFGIKLRVTDKFTVNSTDEYDLESDKFLLSNESKHLDALPLVYLPTLSDLYYPLKAKFAHYGRASQVISRPNYDIYAAWNLGTNLFAKLGYVPWGIADSQEMPNADIVLGLAYSNLKREGRLKRNIGYVNVFDKNGVWRFVQSSHDYLDFDNRLKLIPQMIKNAVLGFTAGGTEPRIIDIHYSKRFSYKERQRTFDAIRQIVPGITEVNFISLDKTHPLRVFDQTNDNLNFARGGILQLNKNEFLLSVAGETGANAHASRLLKVLVWREPSSEGNIDILPIAYRILAMTKLNWRSAVKETTEPVTLKFAEEIARLTNQFTLTDWHTINNQLSKIPWFI